MEILGSDDQTAKLLDAMLTKFERTLQVDRFRKIPTTLKTKSFGIKKNTKSVSLITRSVKNVSTLRRNLTDAVRFKSKINNELHNIKNSRKGRVLSTSR